MFCNITRNGIADQCFHCIRPAYLLANVGGADRDERQWKPFRACFGQGLPIKFGICCFSNCTISYAYCSIFQNLFPPVPSGKRPRLVTPDDEEQFARRLGLQQFVQSVCGVGWAVSANFPGVQLRVRQAGKGEFTQGHAVVSGCQRPVFVPSLPGWNDEEFVQRQLLESALGQRDVGQVWRVK